MISVDGKVFAPTAGLLTNQITLLKEATRYRYWNWMKPQLNTQTQDHIASFSKDSFSHLIEMFRRSFMSKFILIFLTNGLFQFLNFRTKNGIWDECEKKNARQLEPSGSYFQFKLAHQYGQNETANYKWNFYAKKALSRIIEFFFITYNYLHSLVFDEHCPRDASGFLSDWYTYIIFISI